MAGLDLDACLRIVERLRVARDAGRTIFIEAGRILADGPTPDLFAVPTGPLATYLGAS